MYSQRKVHTHRRGIAVGHRSSQLCLMLPNCLPKKTYVSINSRWKFELFFILEQDLVLSGLFILAILVGMRCYYNVLYISFLWWLMKWQPFSLATWIFFFMSMGDFASFPTVLVSFKIFCKNSLYILDMGSLSDIGIANMLRE